MLERLQKESGDSARNISVAQVRDLQRLFATTPTYSDRRLIVIDAADEMERSSANALLKNLEEPPTGTIFLIVSHSPGRLLPTIRSRCRVLRLSQLNDSQVETIIRRTMPELDAGEVAALVEAGEGVPGRAIGFAGLDISGLDKAISRIIASGDPTNGERSQLAKSFAAKSSQPRYEAFLRRVPHHIAEHAKRTDGPARVRAIDRWQSAGVIADHAIRRSLDREATAFALGSLLAELAP